MYLPVAVLVAFSALSLIGMVTVALLYAWSRMDGYPSPEWPKFTVKKNLWKGSAKVAKVYEYRHSIIKRGRTAQSKHTRCNRCGGAIDKRLGPGRSGSVGRSERERRCVCLGGDVERFRAPHQRSRRSVCWGKQYGRFVSQGRLYVRIAYDCRSRSP